MGRIQVNRNPDPQHKLSQPAQDEPVYTFDASRWVDVDPDSGSFDQESRAIEPDSESFEPASGTLRKTINANTIIIIYKTKKFR